jgi:hypothetical protein
MPDFTHGASGPYCTKLLADAGNDVVIAELRRSSRSPKRAFRAFVPTVQPPGVFSSLSCSERAQEGLGDEWPAVPSPAAGSSVLNALVSRSGVCSAPSELSVRRWQRGRFRGRIPLDEYLY